MKTFLSVHWATVKKFCNLYQPYHVDKLISSIFSKRYHQSLEMDEIRNAAIEKLNLAWEKKFSTNPSYT